MMDGDVPIPFEIARENERRLAEPKPRDTKWENGCEYEWRGKAMGWRATGAHVEGLTNTPRRGEPKGARDRKPRAQSSPGEALDRALSYAGWGDYPPFPEPNEELSRREDEVIFKATTGKLVREIFRRFGYEPREAK